MPADVLIALFSIFAFFILTVPSILEAVFEHRSNQKRAQQILNDYMWTRDVRHFFKVQKVREQKKGGVIFDDCLEEECARLVSSRVL